MYLFEEYSKEKWDYWWSTQNLPTYFSPWTPSILSFKVDPQNQNKEKPNKLEAKVNDWSWNWMQKYEIDKTEDSPCKFKIEKHIIDALNNDLYICINPISHNLIVLTIDFYNCRWRLASACIKGALSPSGRSFSLRLRPFENCTPSPTGIIASPRFLTRFRNALTRSFSAN